MRGRAGNRVCRGKGAPTTEAAEQTRIRSTADPVNRALSSANSCLYGICQAAIVSAGFSTALGFIHTGKQLSFVYDIADLYKADLAIPTAFAAAAAGTADLERRVRLQCRDAFHHGRLLERIIPDIERALAAGGAVDETTNGDFDVDRALPGGLWEPGDREVAGGVNWADHQGGDEAWS